VHGSILPQKGRNNPLVHILLYFFENNPAINRQGELSGMHQDHEKQIEHFPISIIMERREVYRGVIPVPVWNVVGVVAGDSIATPGNERCVVIHSDSERTETLWPGFLLSLFKDSADSYWYNLTAENPSLFVICHEDEEYDLAPVHVSANYDEAGAHMEADDVVFSAPMPPEVYQWVERYVLENYVPQQPRKRKRENWTADDRKDSHRS
jgi:hypothetical protein